MLYKFLLIILFALPPVAQHCTKGNKEPGSQIEGTWELFNMQSGRMPSKIYPRGNGNLLKFQGGIYETQINDKLEKRGPYSIVKDPTVEKKVCLVLPPGQFTHKVIFGADNSLEEVFFEISHDTLSTLSGCFASDGGTSKQYIRR